MAVSTSASAPYTAERYLALVAEGVLGPEDRVELLEGLIVAEPPHTPIHASATRRVYGALRAAIGTGAVVSVQLPVVTGPHSVPEPDVAILRGSVEDYDAAHPTHALLVAEISSTSLAQDRLTKAPIYAAAGIAEYWIVNLRDDCIEVYRTPVPLDRRYAEIGTRHRGDEIALVALPETVVAVTDLLPAVRA